MAPSADQKEHRTSSVFITLVFMYLTIRGLRYRPTTFSESRNGPTIFLYLYFTFCTESMLFI